VTTLEQCAQHLLSMKHELRVGRPRAVAASSTFRRFMAISVREARRSVRQASTPSRG
jgi:hypothetical protein